MLQKLMDNPVVWLITIIVPILWGLYEYFKNKQYKELSYFDSNYIVVENSKDNISKMAILYNGKEVDNVIISKFAVWNSGTETIEEENLVSPRMLQIKAENDAKILDVQIIAEIDEDNEFEIISKTESVVTIKFKYVKKREGCVIQVLHTGGGSDISISCKLKDGKDFKEYNRHSWIIRMIISFFSDFLMSLGLAFIISALIVNSEVYKYNGPGPNAPEPLLKLCFLGIIIFFISILLSAISIWFFYSNFRIPRKLRSYVKDRSKYFDKD